MNSLFFVSDTRFVAFQCVVYCTTIEKVKTKRERGILVNKNHDWLTLLPNGLPFLVLAYVVTENVFFGSCKLELWI